MPATFKVTLKDTPRKDGTHAVRVRVTKDRVSRYLNTGIYVPPDNLNPTGGRDGKPNWIVKSRDRDIYNETIYNLLTKARAVALRLPDLDPEGIIRKVNGVEVSEPDFLEYIRADMERTREAGGVGYAENIQTVYRQLKEFTGGTLPVSNLNLKLIRDFQHSLIIKPLALSTIKIRIGILSSVAKQMVKDGLLDVAKNPFPYLTVKPGKPKKKKPLSIKQILALESAPTPAKLKKAEHSKRIFLLALHLHGARAGDVIGLTWESVKEDRITYTMRKNGKEKTVKRTEEINHILEPYLDREGVYTYVFPVLPESFASLSKKDYWTRLRAKVGTLNRHLRRLAKEAGIETDITSHHARHSFASLARKTSTVHEIRAMLLHSDTGTTERYLSELEQEEIDAAGDSVLTQLRGKQ